MKKLLLFTFLLTSFLFPQLKEMEVKETTQKGGIPVNRDNPEKAAIFFYTQFDDLSFWSNYGIMDIKGDPSGGKYIVIVEPVRQTIEVRRKGYKTEMLKINSLSPMEVLYYEVLPKKEEGIGGITEMAITVQATPGDAKITLDGAPFQNNVSTKVSFGKHRLRVEKAGYATVDQEIIVSTERNLFPVELQKVSLSPVTIKSLPPDATVYIDNEMKGTTELGFFLYSGSYDLRIELPGYITVQEKITVRPSTNNSDNLFSYNLTKNKGFLSLQITPSSATVLIDGEGKPFSSRIELTPGTYNLTVKANQYSSFTEQITIKLGETLSRVINLEKNTGKLLLTTNPQDATVKVNKEIKRGGEFEMTPGVYEVEISADACYPEIFTVSIEKEKTVEKTIKLKQKTGTLQFTVKPLSAKSTLFKNGIEKYSWEGIKIIDPIIEGEYDLVIKANGYKTFNKKIKIKEGMTTTEDVKMVEGSDIPLEMVFVEGGKFLMGSDDGLTDEKPLHWVTLDGFWIGKYEVTQEHWESVMGANYWKFKGSKRPCDGVSWFEAVEFCNKLSEKEGLNQAYSGSGNNIICNFNANGYRLPTEAEWEFAARGGIKSKGYKYSGSNEVEKVGWFRKNSGGTTSEVGAKLPNELGLFDMSGNVWEWCWDRYSEYNSSNASNPSGSNTGSSRVLRGASIDYDADNCRVTGRGGSPPSVDYFGNGFRLVRTK